MSGLNERGLQIFGVFLVWISFFIVPRLWTLDVHPVLFWGVFVLVTIFLFGLIFITVVQRQWRNRRLAALTDSPEDEVTRLILMEMPENAVTLGKQELKRDPKNIPLRMNLAQAHLLLEQKDEARAVYDAIDSTVLRDEERPLYEALGRRFTA